MKKTLITTAALAAIGAALTWPGLAASATDAARPTAAPPAPPTLTYSDKTRMEGLKTEREALAKALKTGQTPQAVRTQLAELGYVVTAINDADADYVEYEVVKGANTFEVQIDVDKAKGQAKKIVVAPNVWRADATKAAQKGATGDAVKPAKGAATSDRSLMKPWNDEKTALEKALPLGQAANFYKTKLAQLGYQVTSTNAAESDYLEYEVVKGRNSYEVKIDLDKAGRATEVEVAANLWEAEATERALTSARR